MVVELFVCQIFLRHTNEKEIAILAQRISNFLWLQFIINVRRVFTICLVGFIFHWPSD